jgi:hypothetical protein
VASEGIAYDKRELSKIVRSFKAMDEEALIAARQIGGELATYAANEIKEAALGRVVSALGVRRVAEGVRVSKTSKIGEFSFGFANQKFSGGGNTKELWPGLEFGSRKFSQFPSWSGRYGRRGSRGYFIFPTLRKIQPDLVKRWEAKFAQIVSKY